MRTVSNVKQFIRRMKVLEKSMRKALDRGLIKWTLKANKQSKKNLSGQGGRGINAKRNVGGYPVPVRSGDLRRADDYVLPGRSNSGIVARSGEAFLFNTEIYANKIHNEHPFEKDAVDMTRGEGIKAMTDELRKSLMAGALS